MYTDVEMPSMLERYLVSRLRAYDGHVDLAYCMGPRFDSHPPFFQRDLRRASDNLCGGADDVGLERHLVLRS